MWLITAGPTREYLDDVRFLTNGSSGRMGYELAARAAARGHEVVLVSGPVVRAEPPGVRVEPVTSACDMLARCEAILAAGRCEALIGVAAVCDYRPKTRVRGKPAKPAGDAVLELVPNPDVLATLTERHSIRCPVGFALEDLGTSDAELEAAVARARTKLERKHVAAIVLNGIAAMESESSRAFWITADGPPIALGELDKPSLALVLVERIEEVLGDRRDRP